MTQRNPVLSTAERRERRPWEREQAACGLAMRSQIEGAWHPCRCVVGRERCRREVKDAKKGQ